MTTFERLAVACAACLLLSSCGTQGGQGADNPANGSSSTDTATDTNADTGGIAHDTGPAPDFSCDDGDPCPANDRRTNNGNNGNNGELCAGDPVSGPPCDDNDPCTVSASCQEGKCVPGKANFCECDKDKDCGALEDDDLCNGTLFCDKGSFPYRCKVSPTTVVHCDKADPGCAKAACDPKTGKCSYDDVPDGTPCDDANPCTKNDACAAGKCAADTNVCVCQDNADCAGLDDGDLCNGTLFCDKQAKGNDGKVAPKCVLNPASVVSCPKDKDTSCAKSVCDQKTGKCGLEPVSGGTECDDGDKCTTGDTCLGGKCTAGTDTCICTSDADCEAKVGDGDFCNGTMFCNKVNGLCQVNPNTVITCKTVLDTPCVANECVHVFEDKDGAKLPVAATCAMVPVGDAAKKACDDGDKCTEGDVCAKGECQAGEWTCGCKSNADCAAADDGDLCNGVYFCNQQTGKCAFNANTIVQCPSVDDKPCRKNKCLPKTGKCAFTDEPRRPALRR